MRFLDAEPASLLRPHKTSRKRNRRTIHRCRSCCLRLRSSSRHSRDHDGCDGASCRLNHCLSSTDSYNCFLRRGVSAHPEAIHLFFAVNDLAPKWSNTAVNRPLPRQAYRDRPPLCEMKTTAALLRLPPAASPLRLTL